MLINEGYSYYQKFQKGKQHWATKLDEKIEKNVRQYIPVRSPFGKKAQK